MSKSYSQSSKNKLECLLVLFLARLFSNSILFVFQVGNCFANIRLSRRSRLGKSSVMLVLLALAIAAVRTNEGSADSDVKIKETDNDTTAVIKKVKQFFL